jgi:hypothetical protein
MDNVNVNVSSVTGEVSLTIDLKKLLALAHKSLSFKGSKTSFLDQLVSVAFTFKNKQANMIKVKLGLGDAHALSTINALENTQPKLQVSSIRDIAATVVRLDQFILFPKLPPEVRTMIWKEVCSGPRVVEVEIYGYPHSEYSEKAGYVSAS